MASRSEEDLCCPVCHDIFRDPVLLSCGHSFCDDCLQRWWRRKQTFKCPVCKRTSSRRHPPRNLALKNLSEAFLLERGQRSPETLCGLHQEKLKLFCVDHQEPICVVCRDSEKHGDHRFRPIDEAAREHKEELQKSLTPLQEKLKLFEEAKRNCHETAERIAAQSRHAKRQIKKVFKKLHQFLEEEEEARMSALRKEERQKHKTIQEKTEALSREISALSGTIKAAEEQLRAENAAFLQNFKTAVERVQQRPLVDDPEPLSGPLVDEAKHLGNLSFNIWNKMKDVVFFYPVILDPNSAHPDLVLSDDLTRLSSRERQELPDDPERLDRSGSVLGSEGFDSDVHSWVVEVGDSAHWFLGVAPESVQRKGQFGSESGFWAIGLHDGRYKALCPSDPVHDLPVKKRLQRIRVKLDCDRGELLFSDPDSQIHTFTYSFTEKVFPFISTTDDVRLTILPDIPDVILIQR